MGKNRRFPRRTAQSSADCAARPKKPPKRRRSLPRPKYLTAQEKDALLAAVDKQPDLATRLRDRAIFRLAIYHGLRASEIGLLDYAHYRRGKHTLDWDHLYITRLKGSISADTILVPSAAASLRAWLRERGDDDGPLFPSRNHRPISRRRLDEITKLYSALAHIPREKSHFHALKHTCATLLIERGEDVLQVQHHLGHADLKSTAIYAKLTAGANRARAERLRDWR